MVRRFREEALDCQYEEGEDKLWACIPAGIAAITTKRQISQFSLPKDDFLSVVLAGNF